VVWSDYTLKAYLRILRENFLLNLLDDREYMATKRLNWIGFGLVIWYLLGIYTGVHLYSGKTLLVPFFVAGIAGFILLIKNQKRIRVQHVTAIGAIVVIAWLSVLFKGVDIFFIERFKGAVQITYSILLAYGFFLELSSWEKEKIAKLFYYCCLLIIIGCALENYTPFKLLSDNFRHAVFKTGVYENVARDISMFGMERPKLFTSEPSHVSKFLLFSMFLWLAFSQDKDKYIKVVVFALAGVLLIGSPIVVLIIPISFVIAIYLEGNGLSGFLKKMTPKKFLLSFVFVFFVLLLIFVIQMTLLASRFAVMASGKADASTIIRVIAPPLITFDVLKEYPMWGAGITGKEMVADKAFFRLRMGFGLTFIKDTKQATNMVGNIFWLHWIYFGLFGGILMVWAIYLLMKVLRVKHYLYCLFLILIFSQTMGGYVSVKTWTFFIGIFLTSVLMTTERRYGTFKEQRYTVIAYLLVGDSKKNSLTT
jgi:hypothetical protein